MVTKGIQWNKFIFQNNKMNWFFVWVFTSSFLSVQGQQNTTKEKYSAYLFTYFTGNGKNAESIRFAISDDGYHFNALNNNEPVISSSQISTTGGVRDPHIYRGIDGKTFYMVATDMCVEKNEWGPNQAMVLLKSEDMSTKSFRHMDINV
jgi:arabinoxylan arabinofuranohydrolase